MLSLSVLLARQDKQTGRRRLKKREGSADARQKQPLAALRIRVFPHRIITYSTVLVLYGVAPYCVPCFPIG